MKKYFYLLWLLPIGLLSYVLWKRFGKDALQSAQRRIGSGGGTGSSGAGGGGTRGAGSTSPYSYDWLNKADRTATNTSQTIRDWASNLTSLWSNTRTLWGSIGASGKPSPTTSGSGAGGLTGSNRAPSTDDGADEFSYDPQYDNEESLFGYGDGYGDNWDNSTGDWNGNNYAWTN